jgi:ethanolamine transporter EutH
MSFEESNFDENPEDGQLPEESNNNRTFLIAAGILGGIILIAFACIAGVYFYTQRSAVQTQEQDANLTATAASSSNFINDALTATQEALLIPTATLQPTSTLVVNVPTTTSTPDPNATGGAVINGTSVAATATVGAALTQAANAQLTIIPTTTALPKTGFVDDVGVPGLVVMALAFLIVILVARRLRFAPSR